MNYELVSAKDELGDNNKGYIYGINWFDDNGMVCEVEWFKTKVERRRELIRTKYALLKNN